MTCKGATTPKMMLSTSKTNPKAAAFSIKDSMEVSVASHEPPSNSKMSAKAQRVTATSVPTKARCKDMPVIPKESLFTEIWVRLVRGRFQMALENLEALRNSSRQQQVHKATATLHRSKPELSVTY
mmetsp:Transcript_141018/g.263045  ORF Transcript_141018/g.263045 Transcript_141018/m.263045 type:complete len:126 (+) Transcript_141018:679-1056(+)